MKRGQFCRVFDLEAEKPSEGDTPVAPYSLVVPTVDERANLYLRAVHGSRDFTSDEVSKARSRILDTMAADIATRSGILLREALEDTVDLDSSGRIDKDESYTDIWAADVRFSVASRSGGSGLQALSAEAIHDFSAEAVEDFSAEEQRTSNWGAQRFWLGGAAIGVLAVAFMVILGPMAWRSLQERGYFLDPGNTIVAEVTTGQEQKTLTRSAKRPQKLVIAPAKPQAHGQSAPLGASLHGAAGPGSIMITGLPAGSTLSAGRAVGDGGWRVATADLNRVLVNPPPGFVGAMELSIELRLVDDTTVDRRQVRLEWAQSEAR